MRTKLEDSKGFIFGTFSLAMFKYNFLAWMKSHEVGGKRVYRYVWTGLKSRTLFLKPVSLGRFSKPIQVKANQNKAISASREMILFARKTSSLTP